MITYKEFEVIRTILKIKPFSGDIAEEVYNKKQYYVFKSKEEVSELISSLEKKGYVANDAVTDAAIAEMEPLKVENAIILAAGGNDISAKSVYSMPKGLFMKNGETLIERQIR